MNSQAAHAMPFTVPTWKQTHLQVLSNTTFAAGNVAVGGCAHAFLNVLYYINTSQQQVSLPDPWLIRSKTKLDCVRWPVDRWQKVHALMDSHVSASQSANLWYSRPPGYSPPASHSTPSAQGIRWKRGKETTPSAACNN